jgi:hypothetical protein
MTDVWLHEKVHLAKYRLLAPVIPRYRSKKLIAKLDPSLWSVLNHTILSNDSKYLFVKNLKAACTSVSHAFYQWQYSSTFDGNIHKCKELLIGHRDTARVVSALSNPDVFKFSFIRHPVKRAVSAYNNFFVDFKNPDRLKHLPYMTRMGFDENSYAGRNFDIFLDYLDASFNSDINRVDQHFRPQFYNVRPDLIDYDFVGRVESLNEDMLNVVAQLRDRNVFLSAPSATHKNVSTGGYSPNLDQVRKLENLFSIDFDLIASAP